MTSKEALQKIMKIYGETNSLEGTYDLFLNIKQDLERLEVLEKENLELQQDVSALEDYSYDVDCEKELLIKEIEKLKKAIEILKKYTNIHKNGKGFTITIWFNTENCDFKSCPSIEECIFIKEVMNNE